MGLVTLRAEHGFVLLVSESAYGRYSVARPPSGLRALLPALQQVPHLLGALLGAQLRAQVASLALVCFALILPHGVLAVLACGGFGGDSGGEAASGLPPQPAPRLPRQLQAPKLPRRRQPRRRPRRQRARWLQAPRMPQQQRARRRPRWQRPRRRRDNTAATTAATAAPGNTVATATAGTLFAATTAGAQVELLAQGLVALAEGRLRPRE